ncbi:MAG: guanylate kinase [Bdellovibrionales bacterium]|nr:guanylate kinase [Bdellovibrionales bacterium]
MEKKMILLAAPSGAGKNSFLEKALHEIPQLSDIITYTTRAMRFGEQEGDPYHFVSDHRFKELVEQDFFVEWSQVHDSLYGTPHKSLEEVWEKGKVAIMDIDIQGVHKIKQVYPQAVSIFILPPSIEELKRRILGRDKKAPDNLELRLENAKKEIACADQFDFQVVNDDFEPSYAQFRDLVKSLV